MKNRSPIALGLFISLFCLSACGRPTNRLDVTLQGPWIVYEDTQFAGNGKTVPVLVVIAPRGASDYVNGSADNLHHRPPQISAGDGYFIETSGIYCVTFNSTCAPPGSSTLSHDGYTASAVLKVNSHDPKEPPRAWDWASASAGHTALILPMPDSYSDDGTWFMRFAPQFDPTGQGYVDVDGPRHSIGIQLHYAHGPTTINLLACSGTPTAASCKTPPTDIPRTQLSNSGTLNIVMKAPDNDDACDRHVRFAHHEMTKLLNSAFNQNILVIEPATGADATGTPVYENGVTHYCFDKEDIQNPNNGGTGHGEEGAHAESLNGQITAIVTSLKKLSSELNADPTQSSALLINEIEAASRDLDPGFPRISQLALINKLLTLSAANVDAIAAQLNIQVRTPRNGESVVRRSKAGPRDSQEIQQALEDAANKLKTYLLIPPNKSGNDCLAALMMVKP